MFYVLRKDMECTSKYFKFVHYEAGKSEEDVRLESGEEEKQREKDDQILNWQCLPCSPLVTTRLLARRVGHNPRT